MDHCPIASPAPSFSSVESAWFWTIRTMRDPAESRRRQVADIMKCLDQLYRNRRIEMLHVRIMRIWGLRGVAPNPARLRERSDWRIWHEAMERLDGQLRGRGIVTGSVFLDAAD